MGNYIVDFACHRSRVVVELDGTQHAEPENAKADTARDAWLQEEGYRVVRIPNREVYTNLTEVLDSLGYLVAERLEATAEIDPRRRRKTGK